MVVPCPAVLVDCSERGLDSDFRKEEGGSGREARAGRQPDSRQANPRNGETPGASREGFFAVKAGGGGDVKASQVARGEHPEEREAHEGRGSYRDLNRPRRHRTRGGEQGPEG